MSLKNLLLKVRYNLFKKYLNKKDFSSRKLLYDEKFENLENFNVRDNEFYNNNDVWFSKETVSLTSEGVSIICKKDVAFHESWQGKRYTKWTSGLITTEDKVMYPMGVWVIEAKICDSWSALWLLKKGRIEPNYAKEQITPEIDIMEVLIGKVGQTIHYGYSDTVYRRTQQSVRPFKCDNGWHEFAVELLKDGYNFYVDGILTGEIRDKDPDLVSECPNYLLINNAALKEDNADSYEFIVKSVKFYE